MSLRSERDWYQEQAANPANSIKDRQMWQRLADELTTRLKDDPPGDEQLRLL